MNNRAHHHHRRRDERASWPDTTMADAFLTALACWATAHHDDGKATVTLPTDAVRAEELINVLSALEKARQQTNRFHLKRKAKEDYMRKFIRQKSNGGGPVEIDFGASSAKVARIFEPDEYRLRIEDVRVIQRNGNVLIALDLVELESGSRVDTRALWVDGPNSHSGDLTAANQHLVACLLTLKHLPTSGDVSTLIPKLAKLEFEARLVLAVDNRSGRSYNAIADVYLDGHPS